MTDTALHRPTPGADAAVSATRARPLHTDIPEVAPQFDDFAAVVDTITVSRASIGCIVPAYNEEESIGQVLESLLGQTRLPTSSTSW